MKAIDWTLRAPQYHFWIAIVALYTATLTTIIWRRGKK